MKSQNIIKDSSEGINRLVLSADPLRYNFFDDPEKNRYARAYLESYQIALQAYSRPHHEVIKLFQESWNKMHHGKSDKFNIQPEEILLILGKKENAVSKVEYYQNLAEHSGPLGRVAYNIRKGLSWLGSKILPATKYDSKADITKNRDQEGFASWINKAADTKFRTNFKILGKTRGVPKGLTITVFGLIFSVAACVCLIIATFGIASPFIIGLIATSLSIVGAGLGMLGKEITSNHDKNKKVRDCGKLIAGAALVEKQAENEHRTKIVARTQSITKDTICKIINDRVEWHKNGRVIYNREWAVFGINAIAAGALVPMGDVIGGTAGAFIKTVGAISSLGSNSTDINAKRYIHGRKVKEYSVDKRVVANEIDLLNSWLESPLKSKLRDEDQDKSMPALGYKVVKWARESRTRLLCAEDINHKEMIPNIVATRKLDKYRLNAINTKL